MDGGLTLSLEQRVGAREVAATKEAPVRREGRRVRGREDMVPTPVDQRSLQLGVAPPEQEDQAVMVCGECTNGRIGQTLPATSLVRTRLVGPDCEGGIEQQYTLFRPTR